MGFHLLARHRDRWRSHGQTVLEVNHEFCISIYIPDPSGNMVEFCHSVRTFTDAERTHAAATWRTHTQASTSTHRR